MKIDQEKSDFLDEMLERWREDKLLSEADVQKLRASYEAKSFDWRRLAQYSFWIAMACGVVSLGALLIDDQILDYLKKLYDTPDSIISLLSAAVAGVLYWLSFKRKKSLPMQEFSNDAIIFTAVMLTANAIAYMGKALGSGDSHFSILILFSVLIYGVLETGYLSRGNLYFLGMNYPLRFVIFGFVVTAVSVLLRQVQWFRFFHLTTYICGMLYLFVSLWLISVFGNFGTLDQWYGIKQISLFYWALISAAACGVSIWVGLKYRDDVAREFGITFLFLNIYTRYFEYFWDSWHKALFFSVLAASFWFIGRRAEKIWNVEFLKR
jgi:hypothetical protein